MEVGSPPWTRFELMCHKLTRARTDESPLPEPPADLGKTLVLLGRPVRTRLERHPEQASWTKSGNFMDTPHGRGKRFGLGSRRRRGSFTRNLLCTCFSPVLYRQWLPQSAQKSVPPKVRSRLGPVPRRMVLNQGDNARILRQWTRVSPFADLSFAVYGFLASGPSVGPGTSFLPSREIPAPSD